MGRSHAWSRSLRPHGNSKNDERRNPSPDKGISMFRKSILAAAIGATILGAPARGETPGVTSAEVKVGATFPFSGPASPLSNTGKGLIAYINSINERGGINGRKINLITYDDAYSPPKTVEQTRKLVESDEVAFLFGPLGKQYGVHAIAAAALGRYDVGAIR